MTNREQERIAKTALGIFFDVWCSVYGRDEDSTDNNCNHCEFSDGNWCRAKAFVHTEHYPDKYPQGCLTREVSDV